MPYKDPVVAKQKRAEWRERNREKINAYNKNWYAQRPEEIRFANQKRWQELNPAARRSAYQKYNRRAKYGIREAHRCDDVLVLQGGRCGICKGPQDSDRDWSADHDHETGHLRGMLCNACNTGLGAFRDNPEILRSAALYLEAPPALKVRDE